MSRPHKRRKNPSYTPTEPILYTREQVLAMPDCHLKRDEIIRLRRETRDAKLAAYMHDMQVLVESLKEYEEDEDY